MPHYRAYPCAVMDLCCAALFLITQRHMSHDVLSHCSPGYMVHFNNFPCMKQYQRILHYVSGSALKGYSIRIHCSVSSTLHCFVKNRIARSTQQITSSLWHCIAQPLQCSKCCSSLKSAIEKKCHFP